MALCNYLLFTPIFFLLLLGFFLFLLLCRLFRVRSSDPPPIPCGVHRGTAAGSCTCGLDTLGDGDENLSSDSPPFPCGIHFGAATGSCTCGLDTLGDDSVDFYKFEEELLVYLRFQEFQEQFDTDLVGKEKGITTDSIQEEAESSELRIGAAPICVGKGKGIATDSIQEEAESSERRMGAARIFSSDELREAIHFFDPVRKLGEGGYGSVYLGKLKDGLLVAVKEVHLNDRAERVKVGLEIHDFCNLRHPNLVTLYGCTFGSEVPLLVYEYVTNGNVAEHIHEHSEAGRKVLTWDLRLQIAIETAEALSFLHFRSGRASIIHCDIKTDNILLDDNFHVKVCDFGLSSVLFSRRRGTMGYLDPEFDKVGRLTVKSDVYSFGVVLLELVSGQKVVDVYRPGIYLVSLALDMITKKQLEQLVDQNIGYQSDPEVRRMINLVTDLACLCLRSEGNKRPSMQEVLRNLKGIRDNKDHGIEHVDHSSPDQAPAIDATFDADDMSNIVQFVRRTTRGIFEYLSNSFGHKLSTVILFFYFSDPRYHEPSCSCRLYLQERRLHEGMTSSLSCSVGMTSFPPCFNRAVANYIVALAALNEIPLQTAHRMYIWAHFVEFAGAAPGESAPTPGFFTPRQTTVMRLLRAH